MLVEMKRPSLMQGRNQIESIFFLTSQSSGVVQILWINDGRKDPTKKVMDSPIPGCRSGDWIVPHKPEFGILHYQDLVHLDSHGAEVLKMLTDIGHIRKIVKTSREMSPLHGAKFDLCKTGSLAAQSWSIHNCSIHLGPCCGNGVCDADHGETALNCPRDCK
jgi:hypothetical protein